MADFEFTSLVLSCEVQVPGPLEDIAGGKLAAFESLVRDLYPAGRAWTAEKASNTAKLLRAVAWALAQVEAQVIKFQTETDPIRTSELIGEWERALGLPDPCLGPSPSLEARRAAVLSKLVGLQGASTAEVLGYLANLGYTVTLERYSMSGAGATFAGDLLTGATWPFVLGVHYWGAGDRAILECALPHLLPAQVGVAFYYGEVTPAELQLDLEVPQLHTIF